MMDRPRGPTAESWIQARKTPAIPIVHTTALSPATIAWQLRPPSDSLTLVVKGTFDVVPDAPARLRDESDALSGDVHEGDDPDKSVRYASDFAFFKPKADITVVGHAYAPGGSSQAARVSLRFGAGKGRIDRAIHVLGDRQWQRTLSVATSPTDAAPFEKIPLVYERAFGGPSSSENPLGTGAASLPNLEDPDHPIVNPGDTPPPACFAPVPISFPTRRNKLGTYDSGWLSTRWPYFPTDFDWAYFQAAPRAQQIDNLVGDEPFEITGMHRDHPSLRGKLPGVRVQCFAQKTAEAGGGIEEILVRIDTAAFDLDAMKVNLVWRGLYEVSDEEAPEIAAILVVTNDLRAPAITLEEAREKLRVAWTPKEPVAIEEPEPEPANDVEEPREDPEMARMEADLAARENAILDELRAAGVDVDAPEGPPPPTDPKEMVERLRAAGLPEEEVEALYDVLTQKPEDDAEAEPPEPGVRERVMAMLAAGDPFDRLDLSDADLSDLDFTERSLKGTILTGTKLRRCVFRGAMLDGAQMGGADLSDADLTEARLVGADLTRASISGARFEGANLAHADLGKAEGVGCDFRRAHGDGPSFSGARIPGANFAAASMKNADFTRAVIDKAIFEDAMLPAARLYEIACEGARFDRVKMPEARADGAVLVNSSLRSVDARESEWEGATLDGSSFLGSSLAGAGLSRTSCVGTVFSGADVKGGRFRRAKLMGAKFLKANLMQATFERADLTKADLRSANLHGAEVWKATLDGADLDLAIVTQSKMQGRRR